MQIPAKPLSLHQSIILFIFCTCVGAGILGLGFGYWEARHTLHPLTQAHFQEVAHQSADKLALLLTRELEWVQRLGTLPEIRNAVTRHYRLAWHDLVIPEGNTTHRGYFRSLVLVDRLGRLAGGVTTGSQPEYYQNTPWWPVVFHMGKAWSGNIRVGAQGQGYWELAVPIRDNQNRVVGALKGVVETDGLLVPALQQRIGRTGTMMVTQADGQALFCPRCADTDSRKDGVGFKSAERQLIQSWRAPDAHREAIIGRAPIVLPPQIVQDTLWMVAVQQDPREIHGPIQLMVWKFAGFWIMVTGCLILFGAKFSGWIIRPLEKLIERIQGVEYGQTLPEGEIHAPQEIQTLSENFTRLVDRLEHARHETQRNMKELERINQDLAQSETHYRTLWDHAADSKLIVDASGNILDMNHRAETKLGCQKETMRGTSSLMLVEDKDRPLFAQWFHYVQMTGKEWIGGEIKVQPPSGGALTMESSLVPMERTNPQTTVLLQWTDVTEKKRLERDLLRSERLASLSQFASMFAHDIRNPLAGIKKTLELLGREAECPQPFMRSAVQDLQFTVDLLLGMINDMLDVYQESYAGLPLIISPFRMGGVLEEVALLFKGEARAKEVTFDIKTFENGYLFPGDRRRLQRVVVNLVHNALKYSPPSGTVTLSSFVVTNSSPTQFSDGSSSSLMMTVEDQGPGIDPHDFPHLFELFFKKKDGQDFRIGRGLGLHFCKLVVEAHRGQIWAQNLETGGAKFSVALPLDERERGNAYQDRDCRGSTALQGECQAFAGTGAGLAGCR